MSENPESHDRTSPSGVEKDQEHTPSEDNDAQAESKSTSISGAASAGPANDNFVNRDDNDVDAALAKEVLGLQITERSRPEVTEKQSRLICGDGNMSYAEARLKRYGEDAAFIVTEWHTEAAIRQALPDAPARARFDARLARLRAAPNVTVLFGVDATTIHTVFLGHRFTHIHFNLPFITTVSPYGTFTPALVWGFLFASSNLQHNGDRVYMAMIPDDYHTRIVYGTDAACRNASYFLARRKAGFERHWANYGYEAMNSIGNNAIQHVETAVEFVFIKGGLQPDADWSPPTFKSGDASDSDYDAVPVSEETLPHGLPARPTPHQELQKVREGGSSQRWPDWPVLALLRLRRVFEPIEMAAWPTPVFALPRQTIGTPLPSESYWSRMGCADVPLSYS